MDLPESNTSKRLRSFFHSPSAFGENEISGGRREIYEFGDFRLDVDEHVFERSDGRAVDTLTEKAFQTLTLLIRNRGHLLTKQVLMEKVWPDSFVEENNLDKAIHVIRQALGETPGQPKYIETVRKHGYRFVADVREIDARAGSLNGEHVREPSSIHRIPYVWVLITLGLATVAGLLLFTNPNRSSKPLRSVLVLPAKTIGPADHRDSLLELGIADALINRLAGSNGLKLRPLSSTRSYLGAEFDPVETGKLQNVDYVLATHYQIAEGKIRVSSQLIDVASGRTEDSFNHNFEFSSLFGVQDTVGSEIGERILRRFDLTRVSLAERGTGNEGAYRSYLEGMYHYDLRNRTGAEKAVAALTRAVELDPNYARAWAGKAHAHLAAASFGRDSDIHGQNAKAQQAIDRALTLDGNLADARSAACLRKLVYDYDLAGAERECITSIELDPNSGLAHQVYSRLLNSAGHHDEAIEEIKFAIDLEPASVFNHRLLGMSYLYARRYDEAIEQLKRVSTMERAGPTLMWLTQALGLAGRDAEAYEWWKKNSDNVRDAEMQEWEEAFSREGWKGVVRWRTRNFGKDNLSYSHGAALHAYLGETNEALNYLEKALERREPYLPYLRVDARFDPIRTDARFETFLKRAGL
jgi:DNA-binding winged helix-turn-helix (wHTH) protein/TolB-like protein/Tfp pilus assembly protein PilF